MKPINLISSVLLLSIGLSSCQLKENRDIEITEEVILSQIKEPNIPRYSINIKNYGATGDSTVNCKANIDKALKDIETNGGGKLIFSPGTYLINGPIHLSGNTELILERGAKLIFGSNPNDYLPVVKTSWEGTFIYNYSPFIYAYNSSNIAITGEGIIDGESSETWSKWHSLQGKDQQLSREMNHKNIPIEERIFGEGHFLRPQLIQLFDCKNIKIEGITIEDSPFWCVHLLRCENVTLRGIHYNAQNKNNDGIDPEYSRNVLIEDIHFNNGDDNIAIKAGRDDEGRQSKHISENIVIRNCHFKGLHALVIGSEMSAGVKNIFMHDCNYAGKLKRGIYLKSNPDRGGFIKNIFAKNIQFGETEDCIYITSFYHNEGAGHATEIAEIHFENIHCNKSTNTGIVIQGFEGKKVKDIHFTNIVIDSTANGISMENTQNIIMNDVTIGKKASAPTSVK